MNVNKNKHLGRPKDQTKAKAILNAAGSLFMTKGFERTSIEAVAKKAGVSKLTVYSHYKDKDDLFRQCISSKCTNYGASGDITTLYSQNAKEGLTSLAKKFMSLIMDPDVIDMHRVIISEASRRPKIAQLFFESGPKPTIDNVKNLLSHYDKNGNLSIKCSYDIAANQFLAMLKGIIHMKTIMNIHEPPSQEEIYKHIDDTVTTFLLAFETSKSQ